MPRILALAHAFPPHYCSQDELSSALRIAWQDQGLEVAIFDRLQRNVQVQGRYLARPLEEYHHFNSFTQTNQIWQEEALHLGEQVVRQVLDQAQLAADQVLLLLSTTVTGIAVPSLEARFLNRLPFAPTTRRIPLFGLGCLAGTAGIARCADYLRAYPAHAALLLSVELCSLTLQKQDLSVANLVASGLFGDGAAAVLLVGDEHPLASAAPVGVLDSCSVFFPDSEEVMGWEVSASGLKIVLSPGVPNYTREALPGPLKDFLAKHNLKLGEIRHWVSHPGGPKVIDALEEGLILPAGTLNRTRQSLAEIGNLS
ncbi:MAG: type III polyketide synthase, partial [SAR324 cluster bacterium]|nr:type III polyketide synthase [SAR324 cluster bacterium]